MSVTPPAPPAPAQGTAPPPPPPAGQPVGANLSTLGDWFQNWLLDSSTEVGGNSSTLVQGDTEEYVKGTKLCKVFGFVEEFYLGTKNGAVYGLETKVVIGALIEIFIAVRASLVIALSFEHNHSRKYHLTPAGSKWITPDEKLRVDEEQEMIATLQTQAGTKEFRCAKAKEQIAKLSERITTLEDDVKTSQATIDSYKGKYDTVTVDGAAHKVKVSGDYKSLAADMTLKSDGQLLFKGSGLKIRGGGGTINLSGGEAKLNKHLIVK